MGNSKAEMKLFTVCLVALALFATVQSDELKDLSSVDVNAPVETQPGEVRCRSGGDPQERHWREHREYVRGSTAYLWFVHHHGLVCLLRGVKSNTSDDGPCGFLSCRINTSGQQGGPPGLNTNA